MAKTTASLTASAIAPAGESTAAEVDVLIIGAGLSGIGAAAHLVRELPGKSFALLERRAAIGGTWDLFRYPGVRSDSDMFTLGYRFRPWSSDNVLAEGSAIKEYVEDTADEYGITGKIRFGAYARHASYDSGTARWTVTYEQDGEERSISASIVWACSGYYNYDQGFAPAFPGQDDFAGQLVHPQFWPEGLDYTDKKVVVIGSGATAVTLVPAMADEAAHVTMLQRSPTYILSIPSTDPLRSAMRRIMPEAVAAGIARWRNVLLQAGVYQASQRLPGLVRKGIRRATVSQLPEGYDVDTHFKPKYDPWDQRMCMVPNGDLFRSIRRGDASIVTDQIESFTPRGIRLTSGAELEADIIITATGLKLQLLGGVEVDIDGEKVDPHDHIVYKGAMLDGIPNLFFVIGYTNASWTLKADLVSEYVVRVLKEMDARAEKQVVPVRSAEVRTVPLMPLDSGYVKRAVAELPQAGDRGYWQMPNNYLLDVFRLRRAKVRDGALSFS
jgi:cation diffusion facilitator CzcD-associated flavoprotein CzcO